MAILESTLKIFPFRHEARIENDSLKNLVFYNMLGHATNLPNSDNFPCPPQQKTPPKWQGFLLFK
jgi:hypothetical protein